MNESRSIRVIIADDQELVRAGFAMVIGSQPDMEVVGQAPDGAQAVALAESLHPDVVLMDVPCSGLGVMGKKRDIKYHATPESLQSITELQRQIVAAGWQYVKPHGVLLYSTCTIHRGENQEMAVWITENFPFVLEEERQLLPGTDETDGFYYARLRRKA